MKISAIITLKKDVLDPQGKVIHQTLDGMGFNNINEVRQGKYFEIDVKESDPTKAKEIVDNMCAKLLANLVIENYKIIETQ
jgi:phosphoribosylformylglycinamidine synthase